MIDDSQKDGSEEEVAPESAGTDASSALGAEPETSTAAPFPKPSQSDSEEGEAELTDDPLIESLVTPLDPASSLKSNWLWPGWLEVMTVVLLFVHGAWWGESLRSSDERAKQGATILAFFSTLILFAFLTYRFRARHRRRELRHVGHSMVFRLREVSILFFAVWSAQFTTYPMFSGNHTPQHALALSLLSDVGITFLCLIPIGLFWFWFAKPKSYMRAFLLGLGGVLVALTSVLWMGQIFRQAGYVWTALYLLLVFIAFVVQGVALIIGAFGLLKEPSERKSSALRVVHLLGLAVVIWAIASFCAGMAEGKMVFKRDISGLIMAVRFEYLWPLLGPSGGLTMAICLGFLARSINKLPQTSRPMGGLLNDRQLNTALALVAASIVALLLSSAFFPKVVSYCGRLQPVPPDQSLLSMNHSRLIVPTGRTWQRLDLEFELHDNEALSVIVDRHGDNYAVMRFSRLPGLDSAVLNYEDGLLKEKTILLWPSPLPRLKKGFSEPDRPALDFEFGPGRRAGFSQDERRHMDGIHRLKLERFLGQIRATLNGNTFTDIRPPGEAGTLEVVLFPPASTHLHERVQLGDVELERGDLLPVDAAHAIISSPLFPVLAALLILWPLRKPFRWFCVRLYPYHAAASPKQTTVFLLTIIVLLVIATFVPSLARFRFFMEGVRAFMRFVLLLFTVIWPLLFLFLRDQLLLYVKRLRTSRPFRTSWIPFTFVISSLIFMALWFGVIMPAIMPAATEREVHYAPEATYRVAIYGGSSTRGFPFPEGEERAYPELMGEYFTRDGIKDVVVWNMGVDNADLPEIARRLPNDMEMLHPTHFIINAVVNNRDHEVVRESLNDIVDTLGPLKSKLYVVNEPTLDEVYGDRVPLSTAERVRAMNLVCAERDVAFIDPIPVFRRNKDDQLLLDMVHLAPLGHTLLADFLYKALEVDTP